MSAPIDRRSLCRLLASAPVFLAGAGSADTGLDVFRDEVIAIGRRHFPNMPFAAGSGVVLSGGHTLYLPNIHDAVRLLPPSERETAIVDWLKRFTPDADRKADAIKESIHQWDNAKGLLRPRLMQRAMAERMPTLVREDFLGDLVLFYAIDLGDKDLYVDADKFKRWDVPLATVHDAAIANLDTMSDRMPIRPRSLEGVRGHYLLVASGDGYDAARILLPRFRKRLLATLGPLVLVGMPARDLLVCWSGDFGKTDAMARVVEEDAATLPHALSRKIFSLTEEGLNRVFLAKDEADMRFQREHDRDP